jgi:hypothetical protein
METPYQPSTRMVQTWRFQPYGTPRARSNENAEAGPSNLTPPLVSYEAPPTTYPPGGTSEATTDAESDRTIVEADAAPVSKFYCSRIPHITERPSGVSRPDAPEAQDHHATRGFGITELCAGCVPGHRGGKALKNLRPMKMLWTVSRNPVL